MVISESLVSSISSITFVAGIANTTRITVGMIVQRISILVLS
ncbi:hypothetical protein BMETH_643_0 [methanotrophic bacterial endosymbiont of Bathymodiolus sp.]|nr:hypothetical protein BMETH_643_0 [methanotrophic bacterial endosymbiont of Bathymodiolus sp.]